MEQTTEGYARTAWASGISIFGGVVLATVGLFQFFEGLSAVFKDDVYVAAPNYIYGFDVTTWGWIHLVIGVIAVAVGLSILAGQSWALVTGIVIAVLSAASNFMFLPYFPIWASVIIIIDIAIIWALSVMLQRS
jgi:hypothetical protein